MTGRPRQHFDIAVVVDTRAWHQRGEAIEQLQRSQDLRAGLARTLSGALVEQVLGIELAQPVQGERWPRAVTQQPLAPGAVDGRDTHRHIDGEAAAMFPLRHRLRAIARQQTAMHKHAQQPPAHGLLHLRDGGDIGSQRRRQGDLRAELRRSAAVARLFAPRSFACVSSGRTRIWGRAVAG